MTGEVQRQPLSPIEINDARYARKAVTNAKMCQTGLVGALAGFAWGIRSEYEAGKLLSFQQSEYYGNDMIIAAATISLSGLTMVAGVIRQEISNRNHRRSDAKLKEGNQFPAVWSTYVNPYEINELPGRD